MKTDKNYFFKIFYFMLLITYIRGLLIIKSFFFISFVLKNKKPAKKNSCHNFFPICSDPRKAVF